MYGGGRKGVDVYETKEKKLKPFFFVINFTCSLSPLLVSCSPVK